MNVLADQVQRLIAHAGQVSITRLFGAIVATDRGGFSREYVQNLLGA